MDKAIDLNNFGEYVTGVNDIIQSWHIILHTIKGSDPLRPDFGCGIFDYLDYPVGSKTGEIIAQIISDLQRFEKRAIINRVMVSYSDNGAKILINIYGTYISTNEDITATDILNNL